MTAPCIRSLDNVPETVLRELPTLPREGVELFVVTTEGVYGGIRFAAGEVLVCRGEARPGDVVVLVARGFGLPRVGSLDGTRFRGDAGEPCHPGRWRAAGPVVAQVQRTEAGWVIRLVERGVCEPALASFEGRTGHVPGPSGRELAAAALYAPIARPQASPAVEGVGVPSAAQLPLFPSARPAASERAA